MISATKRLATVVSGVVRAAKYAATHNLGDDLMKKILSLLDRSALTLLNLLVVVGAPFAAVALATNAL